MLPRPALVEASARHTGNSFPSATSGATTPRALARKLYSHVVTERRAGDLVGLCLTHTVFFALMYVVVIGPVVAGLVDAER